MILSPLVNLLLTAVVAAAPITDLVESINTLESRATNTNAVYAHFIVGNVQDYTQSNWQIDISAAQAIGIDGFALNIGTDSWTDTQLSNAYTVAGKMNFKLFISFDMAASPSFMSDPNDQIVPRLKSYLPNGAAARFAGKPIVSTFSGDSFTGWGNVRSQVPTFELIPFVQPNNINAVGADGAFQWNAWPSSNNQPVDSTMTTSGDQQYQQALAGKPYMAGVSPWFYTHYAPNSYNKNYLYLSDTLLIDRWNELLFTVKPQLVEIITWNDFGESHYVGPLDANNTSVYAGDASEWVNNMPHDGWRRIMQSYITAYKTGTNATVTSAGESVVMWYRPNPKGLSCSDSLGPPTGSTYPADAVWAAAILKTPATLNICSGGKCTAKTLPAGINYASGPFGSGKPTFTLVRGSTTVLSGTAGLAINTASCSVYNYNAYVQAWP